MTPDWIPFVTNYLSDSVSVLLGYGNGSFANQTMYSSGSRPVFVVVADFNNDSRLDIIVANDGSNSVSVLLGYGNGSFANQTDVFNWLFSTLYSCW